MSYLDFENIIFLRSWTSLFVVTVSNVDAESLYQALTSKLSEYDLSVSDICGFASDGAANVAGQNNSVWTRVKEASPDCVQIRCICHSLALCMQHAFEVIPSSIAFLLQEVPGHFAHSTLRRAEYIEL